MNKKSCIIFFFLFIAGNFLIFLLCFKRGINVTPDSIQYVGAAKYLAEFKGFRNPLTYWNIEKESMPMTHWPPFYPVVISLFILLKIPLFTSPILLNMFLFGLLSAFSFFIMLCLTGDFKISLLTGLFFLSSYPTIEIYTFAWSETLFVFLLLINIFLLYEYLNGREIFGNALIPFSMLLTLTRFIGIAFIFATFILLFLKNKKIALCYFLLSLFPIMLFLGYTHFAKWGIADRKFSYIPDSLNKLKDFPENISLLFFTDILSSKIRKVLISVIFLTPLISFSIKRENLSKIILINSLSYLLFLSIAMFFFDPGVSMSPRFLFPLFIILSIFIFYELRRIKILYYGFILFITFLSFIKDIKELPHIAKEGHRFSYSNENAYLRICEYIKSKDIKGLLYSNYPDAVYYFTKKPAKLLPSKYFKNSLEEFKKMCEKREIFIVYVKKYPEKSYLYSLREILKISNFKKIYETEDGIIYKKE